MKLIITLTFCSLVWIFMLQVITYEKPETVGYCDRVTMRLAFIHADSYCKYGENFARKQEQVGLVCFQEQFENMLNKLGCMVVNK